VHPTKGGGRGGGRGGKGGPGSRGAFRTIESIESFAERVEAKQAAGDPKATLRTVVDSESDDEDASWGGSIGIKPGSTRQPVGGQTRILRSGANDAQRIEARRGQEIEDGKLARELAQEQADLEACDAQQQADDERVARELARCELPEEVWPELPKPSLGSSIPPKAFVPTRRAQPPASRAMSKAAQRRANAEARASCDGQPGRTGKA
jgi:hypothetical protein